MGRFDGFLRPSLGKFLITVILFYLAIGNILPPELSRKFLMAPLYLGQILSSGSSPLAFSFFVAGGLLIEIFYLYLLAAIIEHSFNHGLEAVRQNE